MTVTKLSEEWKQCRDIYNLIAKTDCTIDDAARRFGVSYTAASTRVRAWELRKSEYDLLKDFTAGQVIAMLPAVNVNMLISECGITPEWTIRNIKLAASKTGEVLKKMNVQAINGLQEFQGDYVRIDGRIYPLTPEESDVVLDLIGGE